MKKKTIVTLTAALSVLCVLSTAFSRLPQESAEDVKEILEKAKQEHPGMWMELGGRIFFYHKISDKIAFFTDFFCRNLQGFVLMDPPLEDEGVITFLNYFIYLLQPIYGIAILFTGIYLIFVSGSPLGRARAKSNIISLILGMGLITLTLPLMQLLLEVPHALSSLMFSFVPDFDGGVFGLPADYFADYFFTMTFFESMAGSIFLLLPLLLQILALMVFSARYLMIILLTVFFPFTVLFCSLHPLRQIGSRMIRLTVAWAFLPVADAFIVIVTWIGYLSVSGMSFGNVGVYIVSSGLLLLVLAPLLTLLIVNAVYASEFVNYIVVNYVTSAFAYFTRPDILDEEAGGEKTGYKEVKESAE
ncbi:MAG: hypothetical protein JW724_02755 [Candidatus Altiarchaeota archaeon]|nr:hypothetical protein [Candidatus Altiarchaeota archaeon]